jgi:phosphoenolpyruvate carboxykinase (GTP)
MDARIATIVESKCTPASLAKLKAVQNDKLWAFIADAIELCQPDSVIVYDSSKEDRAMVRKLSVEKGEEKSLAMAGHTFHFDGPTDPARAKDVTRYLVPTTDSLSPTLNQIEREKGLDEIRGYLAGSMKGRDMLVRFFCLGPVGSVFAIPCVQITDSYYVCHSEDMLYRGGFDEFKKLGNGTGFFRFLHSAGAMENCVSIDTTKKRIYIDYTQEQIYSVNTQYAGNTVGLKKLALRLAIRKADREGWLAEHMFIMGVNGPAGSGRMTYFCGAYPSGCGKTSTAMIPGEEIVGDDLAYLRKIDGQARMVNIEEGIFGIITDVTAKGDPAIWSVLHNPGEVIFSNILVEQGVPYWLGMGQDIPKQGVTYTGPWHEGKVDKDNKPVLPAEQNARYTISLRALSNCSKRLDDVNGIEVGGVIYGGRDSDTWVPVQQAFDWTHGIIAYGASLESETTATTIGQTGVRTFCLMSNLDFLAIPLGKYIMNNLNFADGLAKVPPVFATNYFLKKDGKYINGIRDKGVWIKWMERRAHGEVEAITAPTGMLPKYEDLAPLFQEVLGQEYTKQQYVEQFTLRVPENLAKIDRIEAIYKKESDTPAVVFEVLAAQRKRLEDLKAAKGDYVSPFDL